MFIIMLIVNAFHLLYDIQYKLDKLQSDINTTRSEIISLTKTTAQNDKYKALESKVNKFTLNYTTLDNLLKNMGLDAQVRYERGNR